MKDTNPLTVLGNKVTQFTQLETFATPPSTTQVTCISDEVTALCPVTSQPDWYTVTIHYIPNAKCVESKALKLYLQSFRQAGHFCEAFADIIATDMMKALEAKSVEVTVVQKPRGGIAIHATAIQTQ